MPQNKKPALGGQSTSYRTGKLVRGVENATIFDYFAKCLIIGRSILHHTP